LRTRPWPPPRAAGYKIDVAAVEFLAAGEDTNAWVYRVDTEDASAKYVLKSSKNHAVSYYRHAWAVQDIGGYGENVFLTDLGEESRLHAARILQGLFFQAESSNWRWVLVDATITACYGKSRSD
jgi:hypothetical protein